MGSVRCTQTECYHQSYNVLALVRLARVALDGLSHALLALNDILLAEAVPLLVVVFARGALLGPRRLCMSVFGHMIEMATIAYLLGHHHGLHNLARVVLLLSEGSPGGQWQQGHGGGGDRRPLHCHGLPEKIGITGADSTSSRRGMTALYAPERSIPDDTRCPGSLTRQ